jgi:hypothetical protein
MDALAGGEVQGNVSVVAGSLQQQPQPQQTGRKDLADLSEPFGGAHQVGIEGVGQGRDVVGEVRAGVTSASVSGAEDKCVRRIIATMSDY